MAGKRKRASREMGKIIGRLKQINGDFSKTAFVSG
jgi:hypothetical protein